MKKTNRALALILAVVMLAAFLPASAEYIVDTSVYSGVVQTFSLQNLASSAKVGGIAGVSRGAYYEVDLSTEPCYSAVKLSIATAGRYQVTLQNFKHNSGAMIDVYFAPLSAAEPMSDGNYIGTFDASANCINASGILDKMSDVVVSEAGDYQIIYKSAGKGTGSWGYYMFGERVILNGNVLDSISATHELDTIAVEESDTIEVTGLLKDGTAADLTDAVYSYQSEDESIATVDNTSGVVTGVSVGTVNVNVTATLGNIQKTASVEFEIVAAGELEPSRKLRSVSIGEIPLLTNQTFTASVTGIMMDDSAANIGSATVAFSSSDTAVASVDSLTGVITPVGNGYATISVQVTINGIMKTAQSDISVCKPANTSQILSFGYYGSPATANYSGASFVRRVGYLEAGLGTAPNYVAIKYTINAAGSYRAVLESYKYPGCGITDVYFAPTSAESPMSDEYYIGRYDGYSSTDKMNQVDVLGLAYAPVAGEYSVIFKSSGLKSGAGYYAFPQIMHLEGFVLESISADTLGEAIEISGVDKIVVSGQNSDGSAAEMSDIALEYTSTDASIASVDSQGNISGIGVGTTSIIVKATMGKIVKTAIVPVEVVANGALTLDQKLRNIVIDELGELAPGATKSVTVSGFMCDGSEAALDGASFTYNTSTPLVGAISEQGVITPAANGSFTFSVSATLNGVTATAEKTVLVAGTANDTKNFSFGGLGSSRISGISGTRRAGYYEVLLSGEPRYSAISVEFTNPGRYALTLENYKYKSCGINDVFFAPASDINPTAQKYYVGTIDNYAATDTQNVMEKVLDVIVPEAGTYKVVYRYKALRNASGGGFYAFPQGAWFDGTPFVSATLTPASTSLTVEDSTTSAAEVLRESGAVIDNAEVTYSVSDENIATIDAKTGAISAVGDGTVDVTLTATYAGITKTDVKQITVASKKTFSDFGTGTPSGKKLMAIKGANAENLTLTGGNVFFSERLNMFLAFVDTAEDSLTVAEKLTRVTGTPTIIDYGKVSADDALNTLDAVLTQRLYNGSFQTADDAQRLAADYHTDMIVDLQDAQDIISAYVQG